MISFDERITSTKPETFQNIVPEITEKKMEFLASGSIRSNALMNRTGWCGLFDKQK